MKEFFLGVKDPNVFSYSRFYHYWKKRILISRLFADEAKRNKECIKVLDIGCGNGVDLFYLNSIYNNFQKSIFVGVDLSEDNIKYCNDAKNTEKVSNIHFSVGDIASLSFKDRTFDTIICSEVLEHLASQIQSISEIRRILKDGGILIITTPNRTNHFLKITKLFRFLGLWKHKSNNQIDHLLPPFGKGFGHIAIRSLSEWINTFRNTQFKIVSIKRGTPIFGGIYYDSFNLLFAMLIIIDVILDYFPCAHNFSETIIMKLRKE